jgi:phage baseplate assembly protein W
MPYKNIEINPTNYKSEFTSARNQFYKGFSTINSDNPGFKLYDFDLIKQNIINHFNTRKGQRVMNPEFGSIIWDLIMEPLTDQVKELITQDITTICNFDPRATPIQIDINEYEQGYLVEITLQMKNTDQRSNMRLAFDQKIGLVLQ